MTLVVDLHYLVLDPDLASAEQELWWSAEWRPVDGTWETEDSSQDLDEVVAAVRASVRSGAVRPGRIDWRLHQAPGDPSIVTALAEQAWFGTELPESA